jgi:indolepyruvate ferredoxin oxidoreductase, alpha subunit
MEEWACDQPFNRVEKGEGKIGVITAGSAYQYAKEILPDADILKLGLVYPLPKKLIREFAAQYETLYVIEELDPFIEEQVRAMGIEVKGKELFPICGELTPGRVSKASPGRVSQPWFVHQEPLPNRPPSMCPGCPHRSVFHSLNRLKAFVTGDIGCYTLGFMAPLSSMDTCICMGASIGNATGLSKILSPEEQRKVVAVIGDSTFLHTGINGLMDMVYNRSSATVVILDNRITAMTGRQENPSSGYTLMVRKPLSSIWSSYVAAVGVKHVQVVDPYEVATPVKSFNRKWTVPEVSVVIVRRACMLVKRNPVKRQPVFVVDTKACSGCRACLSLGCPAIEWRNEGSAKVLLTLIPCSASGAGFAVRYVNLMPLRVSHEK